MQKTIKKSYSKPVLQEIGQVVTSTNMLQAGAVTDVPLGAPPGFSG